MSHGSDPGGARPTVGPAGSEEERHVRPGRTGGQEVAWSAPGQRRGSVAVQIGHLDRLSVICPPLRSVTNVGTRAVRGRSGGEPGRSTGRATVPDASGPSPLRHRPSGALAGPQRAHSTDSESHAHAAERLYRLCRVAVGLRSVRPAVDAAVLTRGRGQAVLAAARRSHDASASNSACTRGAGDAGRSVRWKPCRTAGRSEFADGVFQPHRAAGVSSPRPQRGWTCSLGARRTGPSRLAGAAAFRRDDDHPMWRSG